MSSLTFVALAVVSHLHLVFAQVPCPRDWFTNAGFCYKFYGDSRLSYDAARASCSTHGAGLLSVDTLAENTYIRRWIQDNDPLIHEWYTSGVKDTSTFSSRYLWDRTGLHILDDLTSSLFLETPDTSLESGAIIYTTRDQGVGWLFVDGTVPRSYICKIAEAEAYRIIETTRTFDYGVPSGQAGTRERGPHFIVMPHSVVVVRRPDNSSEDVHLECVVDAYPAATYKWFRGEGLDVEVTERLNYRYSVTNGRLSITNPQERQDANFYQCHAENALGKVISDRVELSFGVLGEFSVQQESGTRAKAYEGANIECSSIQFKPAVRYQWMKGSSFQFVRPEFQDYIFISNSGKLYFSEVTRIDEADYNCIAILTGNNQYTIGTSQPPMAISNPIPLIVQDQAPKQEWGPEIQDDFISIYPTPPVRGQDVRLECFAYGTATAKFIYTWKRLGGKSMPQRAETIDHSRVLVIRNAQIEDNGDYSCSVRRGVQAGDNRTITLTVDAKPYFLHDLQDQHVDVDSQLTWICQARGSPAPTFTWYKNGVKLETDDSRRIRVQRNVLTITFLDPELHNGMYQCGAENTHGISLSGAQIRVVGFPPIMNKNPPPASVMAALGGHLILRCSPEASPYPTIEWSKDGQVLSNDGVRYTIYVDGHLNVSDLVQSDAGTYTCRATNSYGSGEVSTTVTLTESASITFPPPREMETVINSTEFIPCQASQPHNIDVIYEWTFNGFPLDMTEYHFRIAQANVTGLYITNAQFKHEGTYTCTARSPFHSESRDCYLVVKGPPKQSAGVRVPAFAVSKYSVHVVWVQGSNSGSPISVHVIQAANEFLPDQWEDKTTVTMADSLEETARVGGTHSANVTGLNPGTGYRFRVLAINAYGRGEPSTPTGYVQTISAAPAVAPRLLRGGGGSVGVLTIRWQPLHRSEYGTIDKETVGYKLYWRKKDATRRDAQWSVRTLQGADQDHYVDMVGEENFYLLYQTKIQAFNHIGFGPNTSVVEVYSAENLPIGTPENVMSSTFNESALEVFWTPVPDDRVHARGKILGYQINYYMEGTERDDLVQFIRYYGQVDQGMVIGLKENENWIVDVQVYNSAGLGSRSSEFIMETSGFAPLVYPQEVHIMSAGPRKARVWWRGVSLTVDEEALEHYALWVWTAGEDFRTAELLETDGPASMYVIPNIEDNRLYALRIAAKGGGGYGRKTPTIYFALEGQVMIDYNLAQTIDVYLSRGQPTQLSLLAFICILLTSFLLRNVL